LHAADPADRFQSAAEVAELLGQWLAHLREPRTVPRPATPARRFRPIRGRRALVAAGLIAAFAVFGVSEALGVTHLAETLATVLRFPMANGTLVVETDDPSIKVSVDGEDVTITGAGVAELKVKAGQHTVSASKDGQRQDQVVS